VEQVRARLDLAQAAWSADLQPIAANDIAAVRIEAAEPLPLDTCVRNARGRFLLVDPHTHATLAAGVVGQPFGDTLASAHRLRREWAG
jgi:sulfate adenylyltransferase subunit 1 (EFTu-like GTPase family)